MLRRFIPDAANAVLRKSGGGMSRFLILTCSVATLMTVAAGQNVTLEWNSAALQGVRDSKIGPPMVARALTIDEQKMIAEYWKDGPHSETPPGHWCLFAQAISRKDGHTLDQDAKLFFVLGNALLDASISAWACKYDPKNDFVRPITAIRERYKDKRVNSWLGPGKGYGNVLGQNWQPYQAVNVVTPPFPEYVSGHSTFTAAGRTIMALFYGTDNFNAKVTIPAGSSKIEPGITPGKTVVLSWKTLTDAADQAGMSRRWGGIHFQTGDMDGRALGKVVGYDDWNKAQTFINGTATAPA